MAGGLPASGFGEALRRVRAEKGVTQREMGERAGIHPNTVARLERGEVEPSWQVVIAVSKALGVDCTAFSVPANNDPHSPPPAAEKPGPDKKAKAVRGRKKRAAEGDRT